MFSRLKTSAMLLLVIIPFLSTVASSSQQATTSTTTAFTTQRTLFSQPVTIDKAGIKYDCIYYPGHLIFTAGHGDMITGSFTSDSPVSFYVVSESYAQSWGVGTGLLKSCTPTGTKDDVLVAEPDVTSLSIAFTINNPGTYRFVFINNNKSNPAHINFNAGIVGS